MLRALPTGHTFTTVLADPPWRFNNRTGKVAPEHQRLARYRTLSTDEICELPIDGLVDVNSHLYLWVPNAMLSDGLRVLESWGFKYKTNLVWHKVRKDGGSDGRGVGFYFRNVTELILFGVRGSMRTLAPGRRQVNLLATRKREHSRKPDELYEIIESCSCGPYLELFARHKRSGWYGEVKLFRQEEALHQLFSEPVQIQGALDPQIGCLVEVLNRARGIRTFESCEGHSEAEPAYVAVVLADAAVLATLVRALQRVNESTDYRWAGSYPFYKLELVWHETDLGGIDQWPKGCLPFCLELHPELEKKQIPNFAHDLEQELKELGSLSD